MPGSRRKTRKTPPLDGMRILVVEDNLNTSVLIKQMLFAAGAREVAVASNGSDARPILFSFKPDVLVTDRRMPVEDGMALINSVRQAARTPNAGVPDPAIPIVLISGDTALTAVCEAQAAGIDAFVVKPFSFDSLVKRVEGSVKRKADFVISEDYVGPDRRRRPGRGAKRSSDRVADAMATLALTAPEASPSSLMRTLYHRVQELENELATSGGQTR